MRWKFHRGHRAQPSPEPRVGLGARFFAGPEGLRAVRPAWEALSPHARWFFQRPAWILGLPAAFEAEAARLRWCLVSEGERPVAVLPFGLGVKSLGAFSLPVLESAYPRHLPFADGLLAPGADAAAVFDAVLRAARTPIAGASSFDLRGLREGSPLLALLRASREGWLSVEVESGPEAGITAIDTDRPYEAWLAQVPKRLRSNLQKAAQKLASMGKLELGCERSREGIERMFDEYVALEAQGWKGQDAAAFAHDAPRREWTRAALLGGEGSVRWLRLDGRLLACQLGFTVQDTHFSLKLSYDEALKEASPGNLLRQRMVQECCEDPAISSIDFCGVTTWADRWATREVPTFRATFFDLRAARGIAAAFLWRVREAVRASAAEGSEAR